MFFNTQRGARLETDRGSQTEWEIALRSLMGFSNLTVIIRNLLENGNALRISEDLQYSNKF